jgi:hypothetical protein
MKKLALAIIVTLFCAKAFSGTLGLPLERLALPEVSGTYLVCIWDQSASTWLQDFETYDHAGIYDFQVPSWGKWYWVGLWDDANGEYVYGKWIGHFLSD